MNSNNSHIDPGLVVPNTKANQLTLREVINFLEFTRLSQPPAIVVENAEVNHGGVADWSFQCSEDGKWWLITIPEHMIRPPLKPVLKALGFKCQEGFYYLGSNMGVIDEPINEDELVAWKLIPDNWIKRGNIDAEMADWFRPSGRVCFLFPRKTTVLSS
jgi:hypothetical protein